MNVCGEFLLTHVLLNTVYLLVIFTELYITSVFRYKIGDFCKTSLKTNFYCTEYLILLLYFLESRKNINVAYSRPACLACTKGLVISCIVLITALLTPTYITKYTLPCIQLARSQRAILVYKLITVCQKNQMQILNFHPDTHIISQLKRVSYNSATAVIV